MNTHTTGLGVSGFTAFKSYQVTPGCVALGNSLNPSGQVAETSSWVFETDYAWRPVGHAASLSSSTLLAPIPSPAQSYWPPRVGRTATLLLRAFAWSCPLLGVPFPPSFLFCCFSEGCSDPVLGSPVPSSLSPNSATPRSRS